MSETAIAAKKSKKTPIKKIPDYLIYEVSGGRPIYYKGYKEVLNKTKTFEEIKMESKLQAGLKAEITMLIGLVLKKMGYQLATGELGINISKKDKRGADLAIYKSENWDWEAKFSDLPPEVIIEIDTQAELEEMTEMEYVSQKIKDYHAFGVKKVIWIFTKSKLVFITTPELPWLAYDWETEIEVVKGVSFRVNDLVKVG
ncbi:MAG: Uma2 family endonuclease [Saprospiraceae bacterium]